MMMKMARISALFALFLLTFTAVADETYISTIEGLFTGTYDANPNGICPDPDGYGNFLCFDGDYLAALNYPAPSEGFFEWYVAPDIHIFGLLLQQVPMELVINQQGVVFYFMGEIARTYSWGELGYVWVPGYGLYLGEHETPEGAWPADPDRIVGFWDYDYDNDGYQDLAIDIDGVNGMHHATGCFFRSMTWAAGTGTGMPNDFADWLEAHLVGFDASFLRGIDLEPLAMVDATIIDFGGPIQGAPDVTGEGFFLVTLTAYRGSTATKDTTWGNLKALY